MFVIWFIATIICSLFIGFLLYIVGVMHGINAFDEEFDRFYDDYMDSVIEDVYGDDEKDDD